ncbi:hypothetical protein KW791_00440 [Candidatus Parcubacteria bacterium]|nr:hypothetical protein [Candidatus Parcubacteria bacterium]
MPALSNPKLEALAQTFVKHPTKRFNQTQSYLEVHPNSSTAAARSSAPEVLAKPNVRERIHELIRQEGLGEVPILRRFNRWVYDEKNPSVSLDATKTIAKMLGMLDSDEKNMNNNQDLNICINIIGHSRDANGPNSIDINTL